MKLTTGERRLQQHAETVTTRRGAQDEEWGTKGWTRRRFIQGVGMAGAAALGTQLVTTRMAFAAPADGSSSGINTVVVVFLRGAADGLRILVPKTSDLGLDYLKQVRPGLVPSDANCIALSGGWALNSAAQPMYDALWKSGELAFVPGVATQDVSRSHFQAQQYLEHGGSNTVSTGWLDRTLEKIGPGTTFRACAVGSATPLSLLGEEASIALSGVDDFTFPGWDGIRPASQAAVASLYRGMGGTLGEDVPNTLAALGQAATVRANKTVQNGAAYPQGQFGDAMKNVAAMLRAEVGLQVATVDVGGWDTHTDEANDLDNSLHGLAAGLAAFMTDLGAARRKRVTVVVQTEFGRRVAMNASGGTDHGHGSLMMLLGGGLSSSSVFGKWQQLNASNLDQGDVAGQNDPFDVLGEIVQKRLGVGSLDTVFPGHSVSPLGLATKT